MKKHAFKLTTSNKTLPISIDALMLEDKIIENSNNFLSQSQPIDIVFSRSPRFLDSYFDNDDFESSYDSVYSTKHTEDVTMKMKSSIQLEDIEDSFSVFTTSEELIFRFDEHEFCQQ